MREPSREWRKNFYHVYILSNTRFISYLKVFAFFGVAKRWQIVCREKCIKHFYLQNNKAVGRGNFT